MKANPVHSVLLLNPSDPPKPKRGTRRKKKTHSKKGVKITMAKKRRARRKNPHTAVVRKHNPRRRHVSYAKRHVRRRRNPSRATSQLTAMVPMAASVAVGVIGSRAIANVIFKSSTGYIRAAAQLGIGVLLSMVSKGMKQKGVSEGLLLGSCASAILTIADTLTGGKWNLADEYWNIPDTAANYLPKMNGYAQLPAATSAGIGMGSYSANYMPNY